MAHSLYLDAARMGRMTPSTQWALHDFVQFAGENGGTLYFEQLFTDGFSAWPRSFQERHPGLQTWNGVAGLKAALCEFVRLSSPHDTVLAGRSASLVKLAANFLFRHAERILVTDLTWPGYAKILRTEARRLRRKIVTVRIREQILRALLSPKELLDRIAGACNSYHCQGVFLPEVSHDGIRLPIREIRESLNRRVLLAVDGAQAVGQVPVALESACCDFYLAGSHKWLGAYLPLGIGFFPNPATAELAQDMLRRSVANGKIDDPLLRFLQQMENRTEGGFSETVNLSPLFACQAALAEIRDGIRQRFHGRLENATLLARVLNDRNWLPLVLPETLRSAILLVQSKHSFVRAMPAKMLRTKFQREGLAVTCYDDGLVRISMPSVPFSAAELDLVVAAFRSLATEREPSPKHLPTEIPARYSA